MSMWFYAFLVTYFVASLTLGIISGWNCREGRLRFLVNILLVVTWFPAAVVIVLQWVFWPKEDY